MNQDKTRTKHKQDGDDNNSRAKVTHLKKIAFQNNIGNHKKIMGIHNKPIIFFNKNNFWDNLFKQFKFFEDEKFSNKNLQNSFHIIDTVDQLKNILIKWQK